MFPTIRTSLVGRLSGIGGRQRGGYPSSRPALTSVIVLDTPDKRLDKPRFLLYQKVNFSIRLLSYWRTRYEVSLRLNSSKQSSVVLYGHAKGHTKSLSSIGSAWRRQP